MVKTTITCRDINNQKFEIEKDKLELRVSVYGVILKDQQVLLSPQFDGYDFPGGGIDKGETLEESLIREIKEETGLNASMEALITVAGDFFRHPFKEVYFQSVLIYYCAEIIGGEITNEYFDEHEKGYAQAAKWISLDEIDKLNYKNPVDSPAIIRQAMKLQNNL